MASPIDTAVPTGSVPIRCFLTPELMPDAETLLQLERLASVPGLKHHVAVLPDVHRKAKNPGPTGTVVVSPDVLVPSAVDTGIGCGIRMVTTGLEAAALTGAVLDQIFDALRDAVPVVTHEGDVLGRDDVLRILIDSRGWLRERYELADDELERIEDGGGVTVTGLEAEATLAAMPAKAIEKGRRSFGTLGAGNHFLELQEIAEVIDAEKARLLGLARGAVLAMLHTGSRSLGSKAMKTIAREIVERRGADESPLWTVPVDSAEGARVARVAAAAANFAYANRCAITERLRAIAGEVLGEPGLRMPLLFDCMHESIKREIWNGESLWVHRHGASRAHPPSMMQGHPVFSRTGQPLPVPGSMGCDSYVAVAGEGARAAFCAVNHGAGRTLDKPEASARFNAGEVESEMRRRDVRLYRYGTGNIAEQAPAAFKDVRRVVDAMSELSLATPVVRLRPIAVLKG